jgi:NADH:ubiquinone reductase (non-electrogenic)
LAGGKITAQRSACGHLHMQERERLLSFVVVGGGPTGVEVAAELHDMVVDDLRKVYPELMPFVRIRVIELQDHVLSTYDREISKYTAQEFSRHASALHCTAQLRSAGQACLDSKVLSAQVTGSLHCQGPHARHG